MMVCRQNMILKILLIIIIYILHAQTIFSAESNRFIFVGENEKYKISYDSQTLKYNKNGILEVWVKKEFTQKGITDMVVDYMEYTRDTNKLYNATYDLTKWYFDVKLNAVAIESPTLYNKYGKQIYIDIKYATPSMSEIQPESNAEFLLNAIKARYKKIR